MDITLNDEINYKANPLHGLSLNSLLIELVDYYGFDILFAYLNINCFKVNPSIDSSEKFLKKTDWARESVEAFYLYKFKNLPRASEEQFQFPPRDRIVPTDQTPGEPAELNIEDAEKLREKRAKKSAEHRSVSGSGKKAFANGSDSGKRAVANGSGSAKKSTTYSSIPAKSDDAKPSEWHSNNRDEDVQKDANTNVQKDAKKIVRKPWNSSSTSADTNVDPWTKRKK